MSFPLVPACVLPALSTVQVHVLTFRGPLTNVTRVSIRPTRFPFAVHTSICAVVSRALLRLTANSSLAAPRSTAVFCFRFAA